MGTVTKILGQSFPALLTNTNLYTVPASTTTICSTVSVCNQSNTATRFRIAVRAAGAAISSQHYLYYDVTIPGNETFMATLGITLATTDIVTVYAELGTLSFNLFGQEQS